MSSVTGRVSEVKQPYGGYLQPKEMDKIEYGGDYLSKDNESSSSSCIGTVVDYLTRLELKHSFDDAFQISLLGLKRYYTMIKINEKLYQTYLKRFKKIKVGLDDNSIKLACEFVGYDVYFRTSYFNEPTLNIPDDETIEHIRTMVNRTLKFVQSCEGEISEDNSFLKQTLGGGFITGFTPLTTSGDFDFCIDEKMIDIKTISKKINSKHTLQVLMYALMYNHMYPDTIKEVGIFNPRTNTYYYKRLSDIREDYLEEIKNEVIGYNYPLKNDRY